MKIESFKVNMAVADSVSKQMLATAMSAALEKICFGVEIASADNAKTPDAPRQKRKYTRRPTAPADCVTATGVVKVTRRKMPDGTTIEQRGNCQGGEAV
jgi:hypothetical protein